MLTVSGVLFVTVVDALAEDEKVVRNRLRLDLNPGGDATPAEREAENERLLALGRLAGEYAALHPHLDAVPYRRHPGLGPGLVVLALTSGVTPCPSLS
jgi:hypothetical protein